MSKRKGKIIACLDLGSSKLTCIIASIENEEIKILGYSHKESLGIASGAISDMQLAQKSIINVISSAEKSAGLNIDRILVGMSASQIISSRKEEWIKIPSKLVKSSDVSSLANKVRVDFRKNNREMIHLIPIQYKIDDSSPIKNPRHMTGEKLYAKFHTISTSQTTIKNIENCIKRCQMSVNNYIVEPYSASLSCLEDEESENAALGTLLIDIGGNVTSFCVILDGSLVYVGSIPVAGIHVTRDVATILNINLNLAEKIKNLNSNLLLGHLEAQEIIKFRMAEYENLHIKITRGEFCDIIKSRLEEIFEMVKENIEKAGIPSFCLNEIVLTGGVALTIGIDKLAAKIFEKNAKIGYPTRLSEIPAELMSPSYSTVLGMLIFLKNLHIKERLKTGFENRDSFIKRLIEKLIAV
jgi:cell division protein FtsA